MGMSAVLCVSAVAGVVRQDPNAIQDQMMKLRSTPDSQRGAVTKSLALQIRALKPSTGKLGLANGLANLATEGDFGHGTLQAVGDTLSQAVKEVAKDADTPQKKQAIGMACDELAQLARFEDVKVNLAITPYAEALSKLNVLEGRRGTIDFHLKDITGKAWSLGALRGKVVVVNMWATWCPPCRKEMPDLEKLYEKYKGQGLVVLAISDETVDKVRPFIAEHKYTYPVLLDEGRKINTAYGIEGIPHSFFYNRQGKLVAEAIDMRTEGQFKKLLAKTGLH